MYDRPLIMLMSNGNLCANIARFRCYRIWTFFLSYINGPIFWISRSHPCARAFFLDQSFLLGHMLDEGKLSFPNKNTAD